MTYIDVFNGDADGIFSLIQWRKSHPLSDEDEQILITGVKRDINLLAKIDNERAESSIISCLDVSFDKNNADVKRLLLNCHSLFYCDHHTADNLFTHKKLTTLINTSPTVCTGLLINGKLTHVNALLTAEKKRQLKLWAIAAVYGDGLDAVAEIQADKLKLTHTEREQLKELGILVNYNGYGTNVDDLHYHPAQLYKLLMQYDSPFDVITDSNSPYRKLKTGYEADIEKAKTGNQLKQTGVIAVMLEDDLEDDLESDAWTRRISGAYGNQLAAKHPTLPVVIVTKNAYHSYTISLRAPKSNLQGASHICNQFDTGGGREGAAGINQLPINKLGFFIDMVVAFYQD